MSTPYIVATAKSICIGNCYGMMFAVFVNQADFPVADFLIDHQIECYVHTPPNFR